MCQALGTGDLGVKSGVTLTRTVGSTPEHIRLTGRIGRAEVGALRYVDALDLFPEILILLCVFLLFEWEVTNKLEK